MVSGKSSCVRENYRQWPSGAFLTSVFLRCFQLGKQLLEDAGLGRFPRLGDRDDLWRLLVTITAQKSLDLMRRERAHKRGAGQPRAAEAELEQVLGREPTPEFAALVTEECRRLLDGLVDEEMRSIALWKMEGYSTEEIAKKLRCVPRTVERRLQVIRKLWSATAE